MRPFSEIGVLSGIVSMVQGSLMNFLPVTTINKFDFRSIRQSGLSVSMKQLVDIADSGNIMPPKTTWFEPKLRSGLAIHKLG